MGGVKKDGHLRIIENMPAVDNGVFVIPSLAYVQTAIAVFIDGGVNRLKGLSALERPAGEAEPRLNPGIEEDLAEEESAILAAFYAERPSLG